MKKALVTLIILVALLIGVNFLVKNKIGDIRPAILPALRNQTGLSNGKQGAPLKFPLHVPQGFTISTYANDVGPARDLEFSPQGTLLVSITKDGKVVALLDKNKDGQADEAKTILSSLNDPHGLAFHDGKLFVAEETRVVRYNWNEQNLSATQDKILFSLPGGGRHVTRSLVFDKKGNLYISLGSTCDVCFEKDPLISTVLISDANGKAPRVFAKGLRNAVFIAVDPESQKVWGTEMGRDFLGDEDPPDEINVLKDGGDYGWPVCYGDKIYDKQFGQRSALYCAGTQAPAYEISAHSAPLGLTFVDSSQFPQEWRGDLLVAYHGSWNRSTPIGYKVVHLKRQGDAVIGEEDFISGFLKGGQTLGRPVDVVFDKGGNLFVSDDKAGNIYLVTKQ